MNIVQTPANTLKLSLNHQVVDLDGADGNDRAATSCDSMENEETGYPHHCVPLCMLVLFCVQSADVLFVYLRFSCASSGAKDE
jgi:hypothetical protein